MVRWQSYNLIAKDHCPSAIMPMSLNFSFPFLVMFT
jgi:hypothetical protein